MVNEKNHSSSQTDPTNEQPAPTHEIRVKGCMDEFFWSDWFGDMRFSIDSVHEETVLHAHFVDQAELYGLLSRLRNKGLALVSIQQHNA